MRAALTVVLFAGLFSSCAGPAVGVAGNALVNTAIAGGASAVSRSQGGCYAACPDGTACNPKTGLCDTVPCRGMCRTDEVCIEGAFEHCAPAAALKEGAVPGSASPP